MKKCVNCDSVNPDSAIFCSVCGAKFSQEINSDYKQDIQPNNNVAVSIDIANVEDKTTKNIYTISSLFLVAAILVFIRGFAGFPFGPGSLIVYTLIYYIIFLLSKKFVWDYTRAQDLGVLSIKVRIIARVLLVPLLVLIVFGVLLFVNYYFILLTYYFAGLILFLVILNFTLVLLARKIPRNITYGPKGFVFLLVLILLLFVVGGTMLGKCGGLGCQNVDYFVSKAVEKTKPDVCEQLRDSSIPTALAIFVYPGSEKYNKRDLIGECYSKLSVLADSIGLCDKAKEFGQISCYNDLAKKLNRPDLCANSGAGNAECYRYFAELYNNVVYCERIFPLPELDDRLKDLCISSVIMKSNGQNNQCDKISQKFFDDGYGGGIIRSLCSYRYKK